MTVEHLMLFPGFQAKNHELEHTKIVHDFLLRIISAWAWFHKAMSWHHLHFMIKIVYLTHLQGRSLGYTSLQVLNIRHCLKNSTLWLGITLVGDRKTIWGVVSCALKVILTMNQSALNNPLSKFTDNRFNLKDTWIRVTELQIVIFSKCISCYKIIYQGFLYILLNMICVWLFHCD